MKKILIFAGAWGWGPITTAQMICESMKNNVQITTAVSGIALQYACSNPSSFGDIISIEKLKEKDLEFDAILSVVEPVGPLIAQCTGTPLIAVDNLFWHWNWQDINFEQVSDLIHSTKNLRDVRNTLLELARLGDYAEYSSMYFVARKVFWQHVAGKPKAVPPWMLNHSQYVPPFLGKLPQRRKIHERKSLLVSLSRGLINPYTTAKQLDSYVMLLTLILEDVLQRYSGALDTVITAPEVICKRLSQIPVQCHVATLGRNEFLDYLSDSAFIMAPSGLTTTFEAVALDTPLITLPEQHDGNYLNYLGLAGINNVTVSSLRSAFPAITVEEFGRVADVFSATRLFAFYQEALNHPKEGFIPWAKTMLSKSVSTILSSPDSYIASQAEILSLYKNHGGGEVAVRKYVERVMEE